MKYVIVKYGDKLVNQALFFSFSFFSAVYRYTVKHLLQHDFFLEDSGLKVELVNREDEASNRPDIQMRLRVVDAKKRKDKHKENEAIQFDFNIHSDQAEEVAKELVNRG